MSRYNQNKARSITKRNNTKHGRKRRMVDYTIKSVYNQMWEDTCKWPYKMYERYQLNV